MREKGWTWVARVEAREHVRDDKGKEKDRGQKGGRGRRRVAG